MPTFAWFDRRRDYAALFIRLAIGSRLISGTQDNVFICGALFIVGLWTRPAAVVMIVNFLAALAIAHHRTPFEATWPALMMLAAALFFLFHGAGRPSIDAVRSERG